ncbi:MAG TPA: carbohydrate ABC transporter permease [Actinocrinis sp.]
MAATTTSPTDEAQARGEALRAARRTTRYRLRRANHVAGGATLIWLVVIVVPLYVMLSVSFMTQREATGTGMLSLPSHPTLANYKLVFRNGFLHLMLNNVIVTVATVAIVLVLTVPLAFAIVRTRNRLAGTALRIFLLGLAIPQPVIIVPLYVMIVKLGLYDSLPAIILPTAAFAMPVTLLVLTGSMRDISDELYESMALDGASPARMLVSMVIPLSTGGISTVVVFAGLAAWNGFLFPLILTQSPQNQVLTTGLWQLSSQYGVNVPATLAALVLSGIPMLVLYLAARRALMAGVVGISGR